MLSRIIGRPRGQTRGDRELFVSYGRVQCPRRGDTALEACFECGWLVDVDLDPEHSSVRCAFGRGEGFLRPVAERKIST